MRKVLKPRRILTDEEHALLMAVRMGGVDVCVVVNHFSASTYTLAGRDISKEFKRLYQLSCTAFRSTFTGRVLIVKEDVVAYRSQR